MGIYECYQCCFNFRFPIASEWSRIWQKYPSEGRCHDDFRGIVNHPLTGRSCQETTSVHKAAGCLSLPSVGQPHLSNSYRCGNWFLHVLTIFLQRNSPKRLLVLCSHMSSINWSVHPRCVTVVNSVWTWRTKTFLTIQWVCFSHLRVFKTVYLQKFWAFIEYFFRMILIF